VHRRHPAWSEISEKAVEALAFLIPVQCITCTRGRGSAVRARQVRPTQHKASAGTFIYAARLLTGGTGPLLRQRWAEYFSIVSTAGLIPLEVYEIAKHVTVSKIIVLLINALIVVYLIVRVRRTRSEGSFQEHRLQPTA
jgi:Predicted membrane protein (DUF2127)